MSDACLPLNNENYGDPFRITHFRLHLTLISSLDSLHSSLQLVDNVSALTSQILKKSFKPTFRKNTLNRNFSVKLKMSLFFCLRETELKKTCKICKSDLTDHNFMFYCTTTTF